MTKTIDGPRFGPASGKPAKTLVVLLHGWGADGNDLISLAPLLAGVLPDAVFVSPHAPEACDMAPMGRQWFSLKEMIQKGEDIRASRIDGALPALQNFLAAELARLGLGNGDLALIGFSQGTMMALHAGLRMDPPPAAIIGFSGMLVAPERLPEEIKGRPPVLLVHGTADQVVPFSRLAAAAEGLRAAGIEAETVSRPGLAHGIDDEGLKAAAMMLHRHLGSQR